MDIQYYKDTKHNYLIMKTEFNETNLFQHKMLENNKIKGLLPFSIRNMDESYYLYYEIDSKQSIKNRYDRKKMSYEKLLDFFESLVDTSKNLGDYLLDFCHIVLDSECVFEELASGKFYFIYDPDYEGESDRNFIEILMDYADMEDEKGMQLLYKLLDTTYDNSEIDISFLNSVIAELRNKTGATDLVDDSNLKSMDNYFEEEYIDDEDAMEEDDSRYTEKKIKIKLPIGAHFLMAMLFALVAGALVYLRCAYILTFEENLLDITVFMISVMMSLACFIIQLKKNKKALSGSSKKEKNVNQTQSNVVRDKEQLKKYDEPVFNEGEETALLSYDFGGKTRKLYSTQGTGLSNIDLENLPIVIGKLSTCADIVIHDKSVSRMHAKIFRQHNNEEIWIQDLNSTNGTFINGKRLMPNETAELKEDDEISFGNCEYAYR